MQYFHAPSSIGIIDAVQRGDLEGVERIIDCNRECVELVDEKGYSCFHWAVYIDHVSILNLLISYFPQKLWEAVTHKKQTVLHIACSNSAIHSIRTVVDLINSDGPSEYINAANVFGETALHISAGANRADIVQLLLSSGADPYVQDNWQRTPRKVALENGYHVTAVVIARSYAADYNYHHDEPDLPVSPFSARTAANPTPTQTQLAAELKAKLSIQLPKRSADLSASCSGGSEGFFGLAHAVTSEKHIFKNVTEQLIDQPVIQKDSQQGTFIKAPGLTALSKLVEFPGDSQRLVEQLEDESIALNGKDMYGLTALMKFAAWDKIELLQLLLPRLDAEDIAVTGGKQKLPLLHYCVDMDAWRALRFLLADSRVIPNQVDEFKRTFKEHAAHTGKAEVLLKEVPESANILD